MHELVPTATHFYGTCLPVRPIPSPSVQALLQYYIHRLRMDLSTPVVLSGRWGKTELRGTVRLRMVVGLPCVRTVPSTPARPFHYSCSTRSLYCAPKNQSSSVGPFQIHNGCAEGNVYAFLSWRSHWCSNVGTVHLDCHELLALLVDG